MASIAVQQLNAITGVVFVPYVVGLMVIIVVTCSTRAVTMGPLGRWLGGRA